jgi:sterol 3beta-glucosyltransferase
MRVGIQTFGTRGDVQPYIALALGLMAKGHDVQLAAPEQFQSMAEAHAVPFVNLPGEMLALIDTPVGRSAVAGGKGFSAGLKLLKHTRPMMRKLMDAEWAAVESFNPDIIIYHPKSIASPHMAEALAIPSILASPLPGFTPTSTFPSPMLPFSNLGLLNKASHILVIKGAEILFRKLINEWRTETLHLPRQRHPPIFPSRTIYAYSKHVVPVPPDWNRDVLVSGYWVVAGAKWTPSDSLTKFLTEGEPPIYVGFGSMPAVNPEKLTDIILQALEKTGKRGLLATGGGAVVKIANPSPNILLIDDAPHEFLFPMVSAVMHHGGAGTTGSALRAGKPNIICPYFGDQPFWAHRISKLGLGPPSLNRKTLSVNDVVSAINAIDDNDLRRRAREIGAAIREENGVEASVAFIEATIEPK